MFLRHLVLYSYADLAKFYGDRPREPLRRGLNSRGVAIYSDVGHVEAYILQDTASSTITDIPVESNGTTLDSPG